MRILIAAKLRHSFTETVGFEVFARKLFIVLRFIGSTVSQSVLAGRLPGVGCQVFRCQVSGVRFEVPGLRDIGGRGWGSKVVTRQQGQGLRD